MEEEADHSIWQEGRSGGWLTLHEFEGENPLHFTESFISSLSDIIDEYFSETYEAIKEDDPPRAPFTTSILIKNLISSYIESIDHLIHIYKFCKALDTFDATEEFLHQMAFQRQLKEEEWEEEERPSENPDQEYLFPDLKRFDKIGAS